MNDEGDQNKGKANIIISIEKWENSFSLHCYSGSSAVKDDLEKYLQKGMRYKDFQKKYPLEKRSEMEKDIKEINKYWEDRGQRVEIRESDETDAQ